MDTANNYYLREVFTPASPAKLTFIERDSINDRLVNALRTTGKQLIVYGHTGSGKTTLLVNKLEQVYEGHITSHCMKGVTFEQLVLDAFDKLSPFYITESSDTNKKGITSSIYLTYSNIKTQLQYIHEDSQTVKNIRALPPQLTVQRLADFLGSAKCCWVLEDFHKVDESEKVKLAQAMKVFMDMSSTYPDLKIIALGAVGTARQVVQYDPEMRNRVAEIEVPLMKSNEIEEIINKGAELLNFSLDNASKREIIFCSNGLASICHNLCLHLCLTAGVETTCSPRHNLTYSKHFKPSLAKYLEESSDTLKNAFDLAFRQKKKSKYNNCRIIIEALSVYDQEGVSHNEIISKIRESHPEYPPGNLTTYLKELQNTDRGSIVRYDPASGKYSFSDPIYRAFAIAITKNTQKNTLEVKSIGLFELLTGLEELSKTTEELRKRLEHDKQAKSKL